MTQANIEKLVKGIIKNYNIKNTKYENSIFNMPKIRYSKEIQDFKIKHDCKISIGHLWLMHIENDNFTYKVEVYKNKIIVNKRK